MSDGTKIEWTDATANYLNGCSVISAGCTNCYAMKLAGTRMKHHPSRAGLTIDTKAGPVWSGETRTNDAVLAQVLGWKRPRRIFWNAHGDLFHESVPDAVIDRQFAVMALTPQHVHQVLTKRPERMREYCSSHDARRRIARAVLDLALQTPALLRVVPWPVITIGDIDAPDDVEVNLPLPNVWLGTSVEDQRAADERIPHLLATPAAVRFLSCEPLLGPVDLGRWLGFRPAVGTSGYTGRDGLRRCDFTGCVIEGIDWVIAGGESGKGARPMHPDWARGLRDQCAAAGVPFFFKQWGQFAPLSSAQPVTGLTESNANVAWPDGSFGAGEPATRGGPGLQMYRASKETAGRLLDGALHNGMPA